MPDTQQLIFGQRHVGLDNDVALPYRVMGGRLRRALVVEEGGT